MMWPFTIKGPDPDDILPGDWVKRAGFKGAGLVEEVDDKRGLAVVTWRGQRYIAIPVNQLRRIKSVAGWALDFRR